MGKLIISTAVFGAIWLIWLLFFVQLSINPKVESTQTFDRVTVDFPASIQLSNGEGSVFHSKGISVQNENGNLVFSQDKQFLAEPVILISTRSLSLVNAPESKISGELVANSATILSKSINLHIDANILIAKTKADSVLRGTSTSVDLAINGGYIDASQLKSSFATVRVQNGSIAKVFVSEILDAIEDDGKIIYDGFPKVNIYGNASNILQI